MNIIRGTGPPEQQDTRRKEFLRARFMRLPGFVAPPSRVKCRQIVHGYPDEDADVLESNRIVEYFTMAQHEHPAGTSLLRESRGLEDGPATHLCRAEGPREKWQTWAAMPAPVWQVI
jgi:hypothetical protein